MSKHAVDRDRFPKPIMRVLAKVDADIAAEDFASGTEFSGSDAMALVDNDFREFVPDPKGSKTLVPRARAHLQHILDDLTARKAAAEKRIALAAERLGERQAAALRTYEEEKAAALAEHVAVLADAEADLAGLTACKRAIDLAVGDLNKSA